MQRKIKSKPHALLEKTLCDAATINPAAAVRLPINNVDVNIKAQDFASKYIVPYWITGDNDIECVKLLLKDLAKSNIKDAKQKYLAHEMNINAYVSIDKRTVLHLVAERGYIKCVKLLLEFINIDLNIQDINGQTALHLAVINDKIECVKLLIQYRAKLDIRDQIGKAPIDYARKKPEVFKFEILQLLTLPPEPKPPHPNGRKKRRPRGRRRGRILRKTEYKMEKAPESHQLKLSKQAEVKLIRALSNAINKGNLNTVKCKLDTLLKNGIDINCPIKFNQNSTTLFCLSIIKIAQTGWSKKREDIAKFLLTKGANPIVHIDKFPLLHYIIKNHPRFTPALFTAVVEQISQKMPLDDIRGGKGNVTALQALCHNLDSVYKAEIEKFIIIVLEKGANPNLTGESLNGQPDSAPLHLVAMYGASDHLIKIMIAKRADINARAFADNYTPAHLAIMQKQESVLDVLLREGANLDMKAGSITLKQMLLAYYPEKLGIATEISFVEALFDISLLHNPNIIESYIKRANIDVNALINRSTNWSNYTLSTISNPPKQQELKENIIYLYQRAKNWYFIQAGNIEVKISEPNLLNIIERTKNKKGEYQPSVEEEYLILQNIELNCEQNLQNKKFTPLEAVVEISGTLDATQNDGILSRQKIKDVLLEKAKILLKCNADPKVQLHNFPTQNLLHRAVCYNNNSMAELWLKYFSPHDPASCGYTPFAFAVYRNNVKLVKLFLNYDMNYSVETWDIIESRVAAEGYDEILSLFIENGLLGNPIKLFEITTKYGHFTAMKLLINSKELLINDNKILLLLGEMCINKETFDNAYQYNGLHFREISNLEQKMQFIITRALFNAVSFQQYEIVKYCLKNKANPNFKFIDKDTTDERIKNSVASNINVYSAFHKAICLYDSRNVKLLLQYKANPIVIDEETSLKLAYQYIQPHLLQAILKKGWDVNQSLQGFDLLTWAIIRYFIVKEKKYSEKPPKNAVKRIKKIINILIDHDIDYHKVQVVVNGLKNAPDLTKKQQIDKDGIISIFDRVFTARKNRQIQTSPAVSACAVTICEVQQSQNVFSGRNYAHKVLGISAAILQKWQQEKQPKSNLQAARFSLFSETKIPRLEKKCCWFDSGLKTGFPEVREVERSPNSYVYLDPVMLEQVPKKLLQYIKNMRFVFDGKHIKTLNCNKYSALTNTLIRITANGVTYENLHLTHEIKISNDAARILLCKLSSPGCAALYLGIIYAAKGLHTPANATSIIISLQKKMNSNSGFSITLPKPARGSSLDI